MVSSGQWFAHIEFVVLNLEFGMVLGSTMVEDK